MKETKIYADEFCTTFASTTEMLEFLAERAKQSKWIRKPTRMLKLVPLEKEAETIEEACEKELEGIVEDTEKNTQLVLKVNKDFYPVRDCAIHTILKRAGINGTGLKKLEKATYAKVVNYCLQVAKGDALIKVADGKVSAVHGGDDHDYCVLDMQTIFNMTSDYLKAHFKGSTYLEGSGSFDHSIVSAMWTLGGNQELLDTYHQALEDHGIEDKSLAPALRLTTSDVAVSGVNLYPMMLSQTSNRVINLGSPIKLSHDRGATLQDFRNNLDKIFSRYQEAVKGIVGLMDIDIQNPVNCLHLIMKELKINQKIRNEVVELFVGQYGEEPCTAHSIYVSDKLIERKMPGALYSIYFKINDTQGWNEAGIKSEIDKIAQQLDVPKDSIVYSSYYFSLISQKSIQYISVILGVSLVIAIISSIVIYCIFFVSVLERIGKYGQMRTLGMTKKQIRKIIKIEGNVLTLKGCFWGCVFGGIIAYFIQPKGWYLVNTILISGMASAFVYFVVMLSLYKPAKIASAASPIEALRYFADTEVNINRKHSYKKITLWRLALLSVQRNKKKTFLTILSLGICGIVLMASSSYLNSIDPYNMAKKSMPNGEIKIELGTYGPQSYTSKQYFDLQKNNILNQELLKKLEDMQAVESIKQYKGTVCDITLPNGDTDIFVVDGIQSGDITNLKKFLVDGEIDFKKMQQKNGIVVSEASEWETLWDWEVKIGDTINILDSEGVPVKYEVVGIVENGADYGGYNMVYMPLSNMEELRKDVLNLTYQLSIKTTSDTNVSKTEDMIRKMFQNEMPIQFTTIDDVAASYKQRIDAYRKPVYGLVIFVGIFGIVNLLNMLFSNMATRKREYGMLQCVGLTDKQLSSIVVKEGILYSVGSISISLIFGTIFGIILCNVFSSFSVFGKVIYHFPFKEMTVYFSILIIVQMIFAYIIINFYKRESLIDRIK